MSEKFEFWWRYWSNDREWLRIIQEGLGPEWDYWILDDAPWNTASTLLLAAMVLVAFS